MSYLSWKTDTEGNLQYSGWLKYLPRPDCTATAFQVGTGNWIKKTYLEPCFNNWYNCTSSTEQLRKISDLLFWPVFSPSPTSYFLNIFFLYFSPPSPFLKLFQKHRNCARLTQIFLYKAASPSLLFLEELHSWMNQAAEVVLGAAGGGNCSNSQNLVNQKLQGMN